MSNLKSKNILYLCSWYPTRVFPFIGNFVFKHARCLVRSGIPITALVVCEDIEMSGRFEFIEGKEDGVEHLIVYYNYPFRFLKQTYKAIGYLRGMRYLRKKKGEFDLIHVQILIDAGFIAWWNHLWRKTPYVLTENSTVFLPIDPNKYPIILRPLIRQVIKKCAFVLPVSNDLEFNMKKIYSHSPFQVIPNVVNVDLFKPRQRIKEGIPLKFLHVSSLTDQKNIDGLLRSIKELSDLRNDFTFTIAGNGDFQALKNKVANSKIPSKLISIRGKMQEQEVADVFQKHDVFVLFSNHENLPCVLVEAQSCGMPIVTTDVGGSDEIVDSKELGIVISARDEKALVESLNKMIDNYKNYNLQKIRERAVKKYSDEAVAEAFISIYSKVLNLQ